MCDFPASEVPILEKKWYSQWLQQLRPLATGKFGHVYLAREKNGTPSSSFVLRHFKNSFIKCILNSWYLTYIGFFLPTNILYSIFNFMVVIDIYQDRLKERKRDCWFCLGNPPAMTQQQILSFCCSRFQISTWKKAFERILEQNMMLLQNILHPLASWNIVCS